MSALGRSVARYQCAFVQSTRSDFGALPRSFFFFLNDTAPPDISPFPPPASLPISASFVPPPASDPPPPPNPLPGPTPVIGPVLSTPLAELFGRGGPLQFRRYCLNVPRPLTPG